MELKEQRRERGKKALKGLITLIVIPVLLIIFLSWKVGVGFFILNILWKFIKIKRRGYFAKDNAGEKVKTKDFFQRWKDGIEGISPLQQSRTSLMGNWIVLSGVLGGMIINALVRISTQWIWIEVILLGSLVLVVMQMIGGLQKYWKFKLAEKVQKQFEADMKKFEGKDCEMSVEGKQKEGMSAMGIQVEEKVQEVKMERLK